VSSAGSRAVKRRLYECCGTVIFGVCYSVRLLYVVPLLKSVARKLLVETVID
jgi:hypothetical protein